MVPPDWIPRPAQAAIPLVEIATGTEAPGPVVVPHPGSAMLDGTVSLTNCGNAPPGLIGLGGERRECLGDHTAAPVTTLLVPAARREEGFLLISSTSRSP